MLAAAFQVGHERVSEAFEFVEGAKLASTAHQERRTEYTSCQCGEVFSLEQGQRQVGRERVQSLLQGSTKQYAFPHQVFIRVNHIQRILGTVNGGSPQDVLYPVDLQLVRLR